MSESKLMVEDVIKIIDSNGGTATLAELLNLGISKTTLCNYVKKGMIDRVAQGIYARAGEITDEMYVLQLRSPNIIYSHETALRLLGLSDREPLDFSVTVATGSPLSEGLRSSCLSHYVKKSLLTVGLGMAKTVYGHEVRCYNAERTICDLVRDEKRIGVETLVAGLKQYAVRNDKDLVELMRIAKLFRIEREIAKYMSVLV